METAQFLTFDDVRVDPRACTIFKAGTPVQLEPKGYKLLIFLIENRKRLVEKCEILDVIWKDTIVTEYALTSAIAKLRKSIGDDKKAPKYIQTVHTRGYRFIAPVELQRTPETNGAVDKSPAAATGREDGPAAGTPASDLQSIQVPNGEAPRNRALLRLSLRSLAVVGALVMLLIGARLLWNASGQTNRSEPSSAISSLVVLPFQSVAAGGGDEYLGAGIADALTAKLSNNVGFTIQPKSTVLQYAGASLDSLSFGRALKVDYVLGGKIQSIGDQLRVIAQLIRVRDGALVWSTAFDGKMTSIFQVQDSICEKVTGALRPSASNGQHSLQQRRYTDDSEAYLAFLKAHYFMNKATKEATLKGIEYFQQAIDRDPRYAMAYAGLADCYRRLERYAVAPLEFVPKSRAAVMKALELDDSVAYAHSMLGLIAFRFDWDFGRAKSEYQRARELDPTLVHQWYGSYLLALNRVPEAEIEFKRFADFQPFLLPGNTTYGQYFFLTHRYDRAIEQIRQTLEMDAHYAPALETLGMVYEQQGRTGAALAEFQKAITLSHGDYGLGSLGHLYAKQGRRREAHKALQLIAERSGHAYVSPYETALVFAGLGQNDKAIECLKKAYTERSLSAPSLRFDPRLANVREQPRFQDLVHSVGLSF